jgi:hypothetical protein
LIWFLEEFNRFCDELRDVGIEVKEENKGADERGRGYKTLELRYRGNIWFNC